MTYDLILIEPYKLSFNKFKDIQQVVNLLDGVSLKYSRLNGIALIVGDQVHWPSTLYLAEISLRSHSTTYDTVRTYGESLKCYLNFLSSENLQINNVKERELQMYRNFLFYRGDNKRKLSNNTINQRLSAALRFHAWAQKNNQISSPLGKMLLENESHKSLGTFSAYRQFFRMKTEHRFLISTEKKIPCALTISEAKQLFSSCPQPYSLIFKLAVVTGMRRLELCNLKLSALPKQTQDRENGLLEMKLLRKGGKEAIIYLPRKIVDELWWYVIKDRVTPKPGEENYVFLNQHGRRFRRQYLSTQFKRMIRGILPNATLHHLRHTFAVLTLSLLKDKAESGHSINPLKTLQILLGHSSILSTEIYLTALDINSVALEEALNYLYGDAL